MKINAIYFKLAMIIFQATKSVISLLRYYRWNKFSILYEESWVTVALTLENHAKMNNMTVNHQRPVIDSFKCCEEKMTCCAPGFWYQFIQDTKNRTRSNKIFIFITFLFFFKYIDHYWNTVYMMIVGSMPTRGNLLYH